MKLLEIMQLVREGSLDPEDAVCQVKLIIGVIVDDSAIGIGNCDATEMYGEICRELEKI